MNGMDGGAYTPRPAGREAAGKVRALGDLAAICAEARTAGRSVVLAHGVFDLLHMGHVRHLRAARGMGDVLIVTVTGDSYVNRGPGRPVFPEQLRAEMLAALGDVDWVGVNQAPTAMPVIEALQPSVYVKGSDYRVDDDDVTGMIAEEREAVEAHGGRLAFTDEITFSSSNIINRHLDIYSPALSAYLEPRRDGRLLDDLMALVERVADTRVLMVGDAIVDEYRYVSPMGKSPKENMIATRFEESEAFAGGVFAAANHVANFCRSVEVITCLGAGDRHEAMIRDSLAPNVMLTPVHRSGVPTTRKLRFVDVTYKRKLFEVYHMDDSPLHGRRAAELDSVIRDRAKACDVVTVTDFGHGLIGPGTIDTLVEAAPFLAVATQSNSANLGYNLITRYPRADYVCIDGPEAQLAVADKQGSIEDIVSRSLPAHIDCPNFIVTEGNLGCVAFKPGGVAHRIPAFTDTVVDTMGAGDAFFAVTAPMVAAGGPLEQVAFVGNAVGAIKVGIIGHRQSVAKAPILKYLISLLK